MCIRDRYWERICNLSHFRAWKVAQDLANAVREDNPPAGNDRQRRQKDRQRRAKPISGDPTVRSSVDDEAQTFVCSSVREAAADPTHWLIDTGSCSNLTGTECMPDGQAIENCEDARLNAASGTVLVSQHTNCLLYTSPSPRDATLSRMPSSA